MRYWLLGSFGAYMKNYFTCEINIKDIYMQQYTQMCLTIIQKHPKINCGANIKIDQHTLYMNYLLGLI